MYKLILLFLICRPWAAHSAGGSTVGVDFVFLHRKGAIARENALLQLKPTTVVEECREFE
jgi:hypothetical protein